MKTKICEICNKNFIPVLKHFGLQKFCSKKCARIMKNKLEKIYSSTDKFRAMRRKYMKKYSKTKERKEWLQIYQKKVSTIKRRRHNFLIKHYGISLEQYRIMFKAQNGKCYICRKKDDRDLNVDHNHKTGKIRKLLCRECNLAIGCLQDDLILVKRLIRYLKENKQCL